MLHFLLKYYLYILGTEYFIYIYTHTKAKRKKNKGKKEI